MTIRVLVAGVGMAPFMRPGVLAPGRQMAERAIAAALDDARLDIEMVDQACTAAVFREPAGSRGEAGLATLEGIAVTHSSDGCASGSTALFRARQAVLAGEADCVLAVGFEEMASVPPDERTLGMFEAHHAWVSAQSRLGDEALAQVAVTARDRARHNLYARFRSPLTVEEVRRSPIVRGNMRRLHVCAPANGAAAAVLCTPEFAARHGLRQDVAIAAQAIASETAEDLESPNVLDRLGRAATQRAAAIAFDRAGIGPDGIDVAEIQDCCVSGLLAACSALSLCDGDDVESFAHEGTIPGRHVVVNPSGGILARGHPPGASGLAQLCELAWQLRGEAGYRQVAGARTALQHNGGFGSVSAVTILTVTR